MPEQAVIVSAVRTAVGKAPRGALRNVRPETLGAVVVREAVRRAEGLDPAQVEDVILGCAFPEGKQGMQIARIVALAAGLPDTVAGVTVNRFCSSGLQSIAMAAQSIMTGMSEAMVAGGVESMSAVPMGGLAFSADPSLALEMPGVYTGMGLTAENVAAMYGVSREDQDTFALRSHQKAASAIQAGRFKDEIIPVPVADSWLDEESVVHQRELLFDTDEGVRFDSTLASLTRLKPVFKAAGTVTAGNSSQTSDGAAAVVIMSERAAAAAGLKPLARFVSFAVAGVPPEIMGIGPVAAVPKALKLAGLSLKDIDVIELNEAFAAQGLAVMRKLELDPEITNVNGGAIALGHPLGATGAKLTTQLLNEMRRRGSRYGMVTMCIGGGMGAAGIFENLN